MTDGMVVGVDGRRAGWVGAGLGGGGGGHEVEVFPDFGELLTHFGDAELVLVDIPIGLPEGPEGRDCDREARRLLGRRGSSVLPTPTRETVERAAAAPSDFFGGASAVERRVAGKGLSRQAFAIAPKIAEVDQVMRTRGAGARPVVRETHPELCFLALNDGAPMAFGKKKRGGEAERLEALRRAEPQAEAIFAEACSRFLRKVVARDDVLDALAAAVIASSGRLRTVPATPRTDGHGLPMEIVFA